MFFRDWCLDLPEKTCGIGVGNFFEKVLPFLAQKREVEGWEHFLKKVSGNVSFFGSESCGIGLWGIFWKLLKKWPFPLGISEEVLKMASILMPQQKSRSRKRHQFWCHRRKSAPIWSLVLSTTDKIRQFGAENKIFSKKAHKSPCFVLYTLRDKKI